MMHVSLPARWLRTTTNQGCSTIPPTEGAFFARYTGDYDSQHIQMLMMLTTDTLCTYYTIPVLSCPRPIPPLLHHLAR